ncbi:hypothetical protein [Pseudomonas phage PA1C]|uniref:Uncharacterized protein n=1 Tax=Pseudomonas phage vB_PaeM_PS119XW TaxID=2601632 RepID=A0A5C1K8F0_9CAUD|nr:hypothetical protein PP933_gp042 [Pseudomonas phage vB_PaeM_PS119XW]QBX32194.1 hypothetical protein [Pseudomonas phage PA1C]QEM41771.1 hypothetical protein [Pseudomonas phage vB_PaeM_PS119XW]
MKEQLLITFKASDFIGMVDDKYYDVMRNIGREGLVDLIATSICWQLDFDNEEHIELFEKSVLLICGYKKESNKSKPKDTHDKILIEFVMNRVKALGYLIPDCIHLDYANRKVYLDEKSDTVYLIVGYYVA